MLSPCSVGSVLRSVLLNFPLSFPLHTFLSFSYFHFVLPLFCFPYLLSICCSHFLLPLPTSTSLFDFPPLILLPLVISNPTSILISIFPHRSLSPVAKELHSRNPATFNGLYDQDSRVPIPPVSPFHCNGVAPPPQYKLGDNGCCSPWAVGIQ